MKGRAPNKRPSGLSSELTPLFRPNRSKYVKSKKPQKWDCPFCFESKTKGQLQNLIVFQSEHCRVLLNKFPYNSGHILITPKEHIADLQDLPQEQYTDLMKTLRLSDLTLKTVYQPQGVNWGLNQGAAAGAGIPDHLHFHMIPRWLGDLNFFPLIGKTKVQIEDLETTFKKLKRSFTQLKLSHS